MAFRAQNCYTIHEHSHPFPHPLMTKKRQRYLMAAFIGLTVVFFAFAGSIQSGDTPVAAQLLVDIVNAVK